VAKECGNLPSEVLVSQTVKNLVVGSGLTFEDAGEHELKGVPDRWHLYRIVDRNGLTRPASPGSTLGVARRAAGD